VVCGGGHDERDTKDNQRYGGKMQPLLESAQLLGKARIEYRDELKPEERLHPRQDHAGFLQQMLSCLGQRQGFAVGARRPAHEAIPRHWPVRHFFLRPRLFFRGTFAPDLRASDSPMAIACFLLFTLRPERPLRSVPRLRSCIARFTFFPAFFP